MSTTTLRKVLMTKEASMTRLRGGILKSLGFGSGVAPRALGAATGTVAAVPFAEHILGLSQSDPRLWGIAAGLGVAGHDLAGALASKRYNKFLESVK